MKLAYFDCFAGAGGDMIVAALLDAGCDLRALEEILSRLGVGNYHLTVEKVLRGGLGALRFSVEIEEHQQHHRKLSDILAIIDSANLPPRACERAKKAFIHLGQAEAKVHQIDVEQVHFHEVGAVDSIVDIVATCVALELMDIATIVCSPIPMGSGMIQCDHGLMPIPAPATAELLRGVPISESQISGEATTPTAAALLTSLAESFGPPPPMKLESVGYGAGSRDGGLVPNLLRVFVGQADPAGQADSVIELRTNLDDCTGQLLGATIEMLLQAGCLDAWAEPAVMKKSRPGWVLAALCLPGDLERAQRIIFTQTTTLGIRRNICLRTKLERIFKTVQTPYGQIRVKLGLYDGRELTAEPEFEDCRQAALCHGVAIKQVAAAAIDAHRARPGE